MRYILLSYFDESSVSEPTRLKCYEASAKYCRELDQAGNYVAASPLEPTLRSKSVRFSQGKPLITDGPFAETREQLGGFFIIEARSFDEAVDIALKIPAGRFGTIEVRPLFPVSGLPDQVDHQSE